MDKLKIIYKLLLKRFGRQHWWPVTETGEIYPKYSDGPKNERQQLEVIFGAILTQNTSWKNAEYAIINLNKNNLINIKKIIKIDKKKLANIIKSSGYHNQKSLKLKNFCRFLLKKYEGSLKSLFDLNSDKLKEELLLVNGIGPETANSIILYSARKPVFVIDAYTKRIFSRIGFKESNFDELLHLFMKNLDNNEKLFNEYHALIVELGKNNCKKAPLCEDCPLKGQCQYYKVKKR